MFYCHHIGRHVLISELLSGPKITKFTGFKAKSKFPFKEEIFPLMSYINAFLSKFYKIFHIDSKSLPIVMVCIEIIL